MLAVMASEALALGSATATAAGAAMYEALAAKTARIADPPTLKPQSVPANAPRAPEITGKIIANVATGIPTCFSSGQLVPAM